VTPLRDRVVRDIETVLWVVFAMVAGSFAIYAALFAIGYWIYGRYALAAGLGVGSLIAIIYLARVWATVSRGAPEVKEHRVVME
jgi:hypothetical protein